VKEKLDENRPLTVEKAADYSGYSKAYLYQLARERKITHYRPCGGKIIFKKKELDDFLFHNRIAAGYEVSADADAILNKDNWKGDDDRTAYENNTAS
jgi:excisionase family DNA binding protein